MTPLFLDSYRDFDIVALKPLPLHSRDERLLHVATEVLLDRECIHLLHQAFAPPSRNW
jgi:hypothetical protein